MSLLSLQEFIEDKKGCNKFAFYRNGGVAIAGDDYQTTGNLPWKISGTLIEISCCHDDIGSIDLVVMSDDGKWLIYSNRCGFYSDGLPDNLLERLHSIRESDKRIECVAFDEDDNWVIITDDAQVYASDRNLARWIVKCAEESGDVLHVCMSYSSVVVCCEHDIHTSRCPYSIREAISCFSNRFIDPPFHADQPISMCVFNARTERYYMHGNDLIPRCADMSDLISRYAYDFD